MRISIRLNDSGYKNQVWLRSNGKKALVTFNGEPQPGCVTADDEAYERAAKCAEDFPVAMMTMWERPGGPPGNGYRNSTHADIAAAIRRLASGPEGGSVKMEGK